MDMSGFLMIPAGMELMMPAYAPWTAMEFAFVFVMWAVMMIGMMTPSAAPMILIYARVGRQAAHVRLGLCVHVDRWFFQPDMHRIGSSNPMRSRLFWLVTPRPRKSDSDFRH
jgi:predicted metal-binding membrane protein